MKRHARVLCRQPPVVREREMRLREELRSLVQRLREQIGKVVRHIVAPVDDLRRAQDGGNVDVDAAQQMVRDRAGLASLLFAELLNQCVRQREEARGCGGSTPRESARLRAQSRRRRCS